MTEAQALRAELRRRHYERELIERERRVKTVIYGAIILLALMMLMGLAEGCVTDAELEARELAYWQNHGVAVSRW